MAIDRIMIVGGPGSGKTWLAQRLGQRYELPFTPSMMKFGTSEAFCGRRTISTPAFGG